MRRHPTRRGMFAQTAELQSINEVRKHLLERCGASNMGCLSINMVVSIQLTRMCVRSFHRTLVSMGRHRGWPTTSGAFHPHPTVMADCSRVHTRGKGRRRQRRKASAGRVPVAANSTVWQCVQPCYLRHSPSRVGFHCHLEGVLTVEQVTFPMLPPRFMKALFAAHTRTS